MYRFLVYVIIGNSFGAAARFRSKEIIQKNFPFGTPLGTLCVNIIGSFIPGIIHALNVKDD